VTGKRLIEEINNCVLSEKQVAFWWIGQSGVAIKTANKIIYLDLYISKNNIRRFPPLLAPEEIDNADLIFGSHDHLDHIDRKAWPIIAKVSKKAKFIVPGLLVKELSNDLGIAYERFVTIGDKQLVNLGKVKITGIASAHEMLDYDPATGKYPYMGFVIEIGDFVIYHSGDTCIYEGLENKLRGWNRIDIMFLPINGRDAFRLRNGIVGNMTYQEAVDLAGRLKPRLVVPTHYDMFSGNLENPGLFADYMDSKFKGQKYWIGNAGEKVIVDS